MIRIKRRCIINSYWKYCFAWGSTLIGPLVERTSEVTDCDSLGTLAVWILGVLILLNYELEYP